MSLSGCKRGDRSQRKYENRMNTGVFLVPLMICGLLGFMLAVGIVFSYLWLMHLDAEARRCPECLKKGSGGILDTELIDSRSYIDSSVTGNLYRKYKNRLQPVRIEENKYKVHYECEHCGHQWTGVAVEKEYDSS